MVGHKRERPDDLAERDDRGQTESPPAETGHEPECQQSRVDRGKRDDARRRRVELDEREPGLDAGVHQQHGAQRFQPYRGVAAAGPVRGHPEQPVDEASLRVQSGAIVPRRVGIGRITGKTTGFLEASHLRLSNPATVRYSCR